MNEPGTLLEAYGGAWARNEADAIAAHWAPERFLAYKAEEVERYFHRWEEVLTYWRGNEALHEAVSLRFTEPVTRPLAGDLRLLVMRMRWDIRFAADARLPDGAAFPHRGRAMGGENHVLALLCEDGGALRFCAWSETPDAALTTLRTLYFDRADLSRL
jgi:hypothetical protein